MLNNIKGAIFDLDGTLIDSMSVWKDIDLNYIKEIGHADEVDFKQLKKDINHLSFDDTAKYFKERFNINSTIEEICARWREMAIDSYKNKVKLKSGAREFLTELKNSGVKIAIATSNSRELATLVLESNGVLNLFENITLTSEVERGKNFPDVYNLCAQRLELSEKDCMVFEDILIAVEGAKKGNFKVTAVYDESSDHHKEEIKNLADIYINSYSELLITN